MCSARAAWHSSWLKFYAIWTLTSCIYAVPLSILYGYVAGLVPETAVMLTQHGSVHPHLRAVIGFRDVPPSHAASAPSILDPQTYAGTRQDLASQHVQHGRHPVRHYKALNEHLIDLSFLQQP